MTNDELAAQFRVLLDDMHSRIDALPDSPARSRAQRLARVAHGALEALRDHLADAGEVEPFSGGDPKPPSP